MKITIEISMYPLSDDYEQRVLTFIEFIKNKGLRYKVNPTATHIFGESDAVFNALHEGISRSFQKGQKAAFVLKVLPGDLENSLDGLSL
ncbi:MAG: hypothetical protein Kow0075_09740 [Salibacteraceae bacterium]